MSTLQHYLALAPGEQQAFHVWLVVHQPLSRADLQEWCARAELPTLPSTPRSQRDFKELIASWQASGLIVSAGRALGSGPQFELDFALRHEVIARLDRDELTRLVAIARRHNSLQGTHHYYGLIETLARELFLSLYVEPDEQLDRAIAQVRRLSETTESSGALWVQAFGLHAPADGLSKLPPGDVLLYLCSAIRFATQHWQSVGAGLLTYLEQHRATLDDALLLDVIYYLTLRGDFTRAHRIAADGVTEEALSARCFLALAEGDFTSARAHARNAIELTRTKKTRQIKGLLNRLWPWVTLTLLTSIAEPALAELAREQLAVAEKKHRAMWSVRMALSALRSFLAADGTRNVLDERGWMRQAGAWDELLLWSVVAHVTGERVSSELTKQIAYRQPILARAGFVWPATELARVQAHASDPAAPIAGLLAIYTSEEPWERTLRALESALVLARGGSDSTVPAAPEERLVWSLVIEGAGAYQLSARVQTRTKSGFSGGRQVSWKKLHESALDAPYVTAADRPVIAQIELVRDFHHPGAGSYQLAAQAPLALVAHPLVFADIECRTPVEVMRREVRIDVRERDGQVHVDLVPSACVRDAVVCERDGAERVLVYALRPEQRAIGAQVSQQGLRLPAAARPRAQQVLGQLATHFAVSSELPLETPAIEEVPADARLHIQLRRAGTGLRVRWCVLPLGSGPQFAPGVGSANVLGTRLDQTSNTSVRCTRDLAGESRELARVLTACPTLADVAPDTRELSLTDLTACLELLCELRALGDGVLVEWPDGLPLTVLAERDLRDVKLVLRESGSWFQAEGELSVDETRKLSFRALLELMKERTGRFVRLDDGQFVALSESLQRGLDSALALSRVRGAHLELHPLSVLGIGGLSATELQTDPRIAERLQRAREALELVPEVPHTFEASLRPYQQQGFVFLSRLAHWGAGAVLADDMGLGKTLQTLALMVEQATHGPALVVAPTSVCANWLDEARKFAPSLRVVRFGSNTREQAVRELGPFDVLVCSYGALQQHAELLASKRFQVIVLDEAQAIKNASTRRAKAALELVGNVRIALTGTPIENHLGELWSILSFANPGLLGSPKSFEDRFVKPIQRDGDRAAAQRLRRIIKPFVLRRRKSEVLDDLPEKTIITLRVEPSDDERAFFAALREQALLRVTDRDKPGEARMRLLAELMRLRRAACHPALVAPESALASTKLATLEALLEELIQGGHRVLVFSQFVDYLTLVRERMVALNISHQYLDGSSSTRARADSVAAFQAGTSDVFLISLKAGGFGLNLTAADYVVHLDPWWNPAVEDQASDRVHRIGQTRPVTIYRLVMEGSIEEKILALHASKRELADDLLEGTGTGPTLGLDELLALLAEPSGEQDGSAPRAAGGR